MKAIRDRQASGSSKMRNSPARAAALVVSPSDARHVRVCSGNEPEQPERHQYAGKPHDKSYLWRSGCVRCRADVVPVCPGNPGESPKPLPNRDICLLHTKTRYRVTAITVSKPRYFVFS